jgi:hypothetical protein
MRFQVIPNGSRTPNEGRDVGYLWTDNQRTREGRVTGTSPMRSVNERTIVGQFRRIVREAHV